MRTTLLIFPCLSAVLFSGCGLIAVPSSATLPPAHFRSVTVREAGSRRPLANATVRYEGRYGTNWARLEEPLNASLATKPTRTTPKVILTALPSGNGQFAFSPVRRVEWLHVLFPIGLPLGGVLQHYYTSSIVATAPGHSAVRVSGHPPARHTSPFSEYSGSLTILLPLTSQ